MWIATGNVKVGGERLAQAQAGRVWFRENMATQNNPPRPELLPSKRSFHHISTCMLLPITLEKASQTHV